MDTTDNQKHLQAPWDTLWMNVNLATMQGAGLGIMENAAIALKDGKIAWLGPLQDVPDSSEPLAKDMVDGAQVWITPGLIDCHTHLVYGGSRADEFALRLQGKSYAEIAKAGGGILSTVRATREATAMELLQDSEKRLWSFLQEGVTTIEIKSGYGLDTANEIKMLQVARQLALNYPVRVCTTFLGAHTVPAEFAGNKDAYVAMICDEMLPAIAQEGLADAVDGFCESIAFSPAQIEKIFEAATRLNLPVKLHAEQLSDQGSAALAARYKALSADHLEHASESGIRAMAAAGTVAVLLPGAFYTLRESKKPPVELLRQHNVPIAIASDCNPGTSPTCSLLLMLNMGCTLFGLTPEEALRGVTCNAARALGIAAEVGTLEVGKQADLAVWDIAHPGELAYHFGYNPCLGSFKQGVLRVSKG